MVCIGGTYIACTSRLSFYMQFASRVLYYTPIEPKWYIFAIIFPFGRCRLVPYACAMPNIYPSQDVLIRLLREVRKERQIKQEELSERLGKHRTFVTKYESGDRRLDVFELLAICSELSLDVHAVVDAIVGKTPPGTYQHEEYLHGFAKGFLIGKGYKVEGGVFAENNGE